MVAVLHSGGVKLTCGPQDKKTRSVLTKQETRVTFPSLPREFVQNLDKICPFDSSKYVTCCAGFVFIFRFR